LLQESDKDDAIIKETPDLPTVEDDPAARSLLRPDNPVRFQSLALSKRATDIRQAKSSIKGTYATCWEHIAS